MSAPEPNCSSVSTVRLWAEQVGACAAVDWWSMPQWSRNADWPGGPDPFSEAIFQANMQSFHKQCFLATSALCLLKRLPEPGVRFGDVDVCARMRHHAAGVERIVNFLKLPSLRLKERFGAPVELHGR